LPAHERAEGSRAGDDAVPALNVSPAAEFGCLSAHAPAGFVVTNPAGRICFANQEFCGLIHADPSDIVGNTFQQLLPPGGKLYYENQLVPMLLLRGSAREISLELVAADGQRTPVFINAVVHRRPEDDAQLVLLSVFEAHQRRLYERELLRARKEFEQMAEVVQRSSDAILRLTPDGTIQTWNTGAEQIFGFLQRDVVGRPMTDLFDSAAAANLHNGFLHLGQGLDVSLEGIGIRKDGKKVELSVNLTPHLDAPGVLVAFSAVIRDITSRKQAERALVQNEKLASVGRLASSIAHEINNPLEAVTNLLYILEFRVEDEENRALVATAQAELARVSHIATHTLRFHKQSSARTVVHLGTLADSVLSLYRARLENSSIEVINDSSGASPLLCFEGELRQVLMNLVSNAFDAMRAGGRLCIRTRDVTLWRSGAAGVRVTIADSGAGMDPETLQRIFEPFFSTKGIGGTGLGLWITKDLVEKNRGTIRFRSSKKMGRSGTVVTLLFPHQADDGGDTNRSGS
jgi:PAS domain S-box-containing protein